MIRQGPRYRQLQRAQRQQFGPRVCNGVELPKAPPLVVAIAEGVLPDPEQFINELFKRVPELATTKIRNWLIQNLRHAMPPKPPGKSSPKSRCGICSSNWFGYPTTQHSQEACPIPTELRAMFLAINTRAICLDCRGRSDYHDICLGKKEACRVCQSNGKMNAYHQPPLGVCDIPADKIKAVFDEYRRMQYERIANLSTEEPFSVIFYNDCPFQSKEPANLFGVTAFYDEFKTIGPVLYTPDAYYEGLIPVQFENERRILEKDIDEWCFSFYERGNDHLVPLDNNTKQKIEAYRTEYSIANPIQILKPSIPAQSRPHFVSVRGRELGEEENIKSRQFSQQTITSLSEQLAGKLVWFSNILDSYNETMEIHLRTKNEPWSREDFFRRCQSSNLRKIEDIKACPDLAIQKLEMDVFTANRFMEESGMENYRDHKIYEVGDKSKLMETLLSFWNGDNHAEMIIELQKLLIGQHDDKEVVNAAWYWFDPDYQSNERRQYLEILLKLGYIVALSKTKVTTVAAKAINQFDLYAKTMPLTIPTSECFWQVPGGKRNEYFTYYCINVAKQLP